MSTVGTKATAGQSAALRSSNVNWSQVCVALSERYFPRYKAAVYAKHRSVQAKKETVQQTQGRWKPRSHVDLVDAKKKRN